MITANIYYDLAIQKMTRMVLPCVSAQKGEQLLCKSTYKNHRALQLATFKIKRAKRNVFPENENDTGGLGYKKELAIYYAKHLLQEIFDIPLPGKTAVTLYAKQLLKLQAEMFIEKYPDGYKRALIISPDPLEQNVFSRSFEVNIFCQPRPRIKLSC